MIARDLSRTYEELMDTVTPRALLRWRVLYEIEGRERAKAQKQG